LIEGTNRHVDGKAKAGDLRLEMFAILIPQLTDSDPILGEGCTCRGPRSLCSCLRYPAPLSIPYNSVCSVRKGIIIHVIGREQ
jgi:hypothetical protein